LGLWGNTNPNTKANLRNAKDARRSQEMTCPCAPLGMASHRRGAVVQTTTEEAYCWRRWGTEMGNGVGVTAGENVCQAETLRQTMQ